MNDLAITTAKRAESILAQRFGGTIHLGEGSNLGGSARSRVLRFSVLEGPVSVSESVIVKHTTSEIFDARGTEHASWLFFNDWASLLFLHQQAPSLAPEVYGGDQQAGLFMIEDLTEGKRLDHLLLDNDAEVAEAGLLAYARLHGQLHANTAEQQEKYLHIRQQFGPVASDDSYYTYHWLPSALQEITDLLNVPLQKGVDEELAYLISTLVNPGPFLSFIQADAAPDNFLFGGANWRLIDFEGAHYTHALLEGVYLRMPFPTCWCVYRMPEAVIQRVENAYRTELIQGCSAAADDTLFYQGVVEACIIWALSFHKMMRSLEKMLPEDRCLIALTDRQRFLLYLNAAVNASETFEHLPAVRGTLRACANKLTNLWPEAVDPPYYPAFR